MNEWLEEEKKKWLDIILWVNNEKKEKELVRSFIKDTIQKLEEEFRKKKEERKGLIETFHFFRYSNPQSPPEDPSPYHVRLVLCGDREKLKAEFKPKIGELVKKNLIIRFDPEEDFRKYPNEEEVNKLGGKENFEKAMKLFEIGSRAAVPFIDKFDQKIDPNLAWFVIHSIFNASGYHGLEEAISCLYAARNRGVNPLDIFIQELERLRSSE